MKTNKSIIRRLALLAVLAASILSAYGVPPIPIATEAELEAHKNDTGTLRIVDNITLTQDILIGGGVVLEFAPGLKFLKGVNSVNVVIQGALPTRPECIFAPGPPPLLRKWKPGEIRGVMGNRDRLAEWWGARANSTSTDSVRAINCAVGAVPVSSATGVGNGPHTVQLGSGLYYISGPIVMTNTQCTLRGRSSFNSGLVAIPNGESGFKWLDHLSRYDRITRFDPASQSDFSVQTFTSSNHAAMVYVGGADFTSAGIAAHFQQFRNPDRFAAKTSVYDLAFGPLGEYPYPATPQNPDPPYMPNNGRMSSISCLHNENVNASCVNTGTVLQHINGGEYTAYGVGFCDLTTVDGLVLHGFHMNNSGTYATKPAHPIYLPPGTTNCTIETGTVGGGYHKYPPQPYGTPLPASGFWSGSLDVVGIVARGTGIVIRDVHMEHCHVGVDVIASPVSPVSKPPTDVRITNVDYFTADPAWTVHHAVVRLRGPLAENSIPDDGHLNVVIRNITTQNQGEYHYLLYEPGTGSPFFLYDKVPVYTTAPMMTYYRRFYQYPNFFVTGPLH